MAGSQRFSIVCEKERCGRRSGLERTAYAFIGFEESRRNSEDQLIVRGSLQFSGNGIRFADPLVHSVPFVFETMDEGFVSLLLVQQRLRRDRSSMGYSRQLPLEILDLFL